NADTASRHPDHFKPRLCERLNHILTAFYLPDMIKSITRWIDALYHVGEIKGRQDVIQALTEAGLEVVRVTRSSISIA
ncbi:hypothetical protein PSZ46_23570, partial [Shigella flexneri]|nr:hypothetical protein [Shigella flexneri]